MIQVWHDRSHERGVRTGVGVFDTGRLRRRRSARQAADGRRRVATDRSRPRQRGIRRVCPGGQPDLPAGAGQRAIRLRGGAGGRDRQPGGTGRVRGRPRLPGDALRTDPADRGAQLPWQRRTPAVAADPVACGAVLQHRPAPSARPGAGVAGQDRRRVPPGMDRPVLRPGPAASPRAWLILMRLATWNINSTRARLDRLTAWIARRDVDVLAIQETKIPDDKFPLAPFENLGYQVAHHGTNQWNGVAILSRVGLDDIRIGVPGLPSFGDPAVAEARSVGAVCAGVRVWSLYVPNGRAIGDPHYDYKLEWLAALRDYGAKELAADPRAQIALCGDFK